MCLAVPSLVLRVEGAQAWVDTRGAQREVSLMLLDEPVAAGDYLLIQNGRFAYERLSAEAARQALALIDEVVAGHAGADLLAW